MLGVSTVASYEGSVQNEAVLSSSGNETNIIVSSEHERNDIAVSEQMRNNSAGRSVSTIRVIHSRDVHVGDITNYNFMTEKQWAEFLAKKNSNKYPSTKEYSALRSCAEPVKFTDINGIRYHIGEGWKDLGRKLRKTEGELEQLYIDNKDYGLNEVIYQLLIDWQRNSENVTIGVLSSCLFDSKQHVALHKLYKLHKSKKAPTATAKTCK